MTTPITSEFQTWEQILLMLSFNEEDYLQFQTNLSTQEARTSPTNQHEGNTGFYFCLKPLDHVCSAGKGVPT
uniref:Uncharacterized protein n=1 Tax=Oryza brachyantha TaxID=4533 RepID=J3M8M3_ORYBR